MPEDTDQLNAQQKRRFWKDHLQWWQKSGLSQRAYCHKHHLAPHQFYYWRRRILKPPTEVSFLPVTLPVDPIRQPLAVRILMPNGCTMELEGFNELEQLVTLVAAL